MHDQKMVIHISYIIAKLVASYNTAFEALEPDLHSKPTQSPYSYVSKVSSLFCLDEQKQILTRLYINETEAEHSSL
jgi:hypothetical protein